MNTTHDKNAQGQGKSYFWIFEILLVAAIVPALIFGVSSLNQLPIA